MKKVAPVLLSILMIFVLCASLPISIAANENDKPLKVALCLTGPANDNGWCQLAYDGLVAAEKEYGIEYSYTENLQPTDMEAALTDYAAQGYGLVIGLGFQFGDPALKVAEKYPDVNFIVFEGSVEADNVLSCQIANHQSRYLLGYLAKLFLL